jgi:DNA polymerase III subunit epsilon
MDIGIIVDLETTGLNKDTDEIIEIGIIEFAISSTTNAILSTYGALQQATEPLSDDIIKITGISDEILQGRKIDWHIVAGYFSKAAVVVAHNAQFDRGFLEKVPELRQIKSHWACSRKHISWVTKGYSSQKLNYLAADHGFVNSFAHRAVFDCATTYRLVLPYLEEMVATSFEKEFEIKACKAPFACKDLLKQRGYLWDPEQKVWKLTVFKKSLAAEQEFLRQEVYKTSRDIFEVVSCN